MDEYPDFTFSQSTAALYLATEQHHPELFKQIQQRVKEGRWEIVGGRWCEGDLNMISPESHVRHFLYAQRYFQQKFGRMCTDGWEPDTFGHPWTMPQILRKAGIRSYYFCRGGGGSVDRPIHQNPLFWWEGPDGSKVLAFNETPSGGWYNDVVTDDKVREVAQFAAKTGARDHLMVYGVGNHGGGPTRENIQAALAMRDYKPWPQIKFSTLGAFFDRLYAQADRLHVPTVREELNPEFEGCYTSHSRIKRYNRDSESLLVSAEVFAALAAANGRAYPRDELEQLWHDLLWNHHHDTICGSFVHASSLYSAEMYEKLLKRGQEIRQRSQRALLGRAPGSATEIRIAVFNPLAWTRTEPAEATLALPAGTAGAQLTDSDGDVPTQVLTKHTDGDTTTARVCFLARGVPGCGFKVFGVRALPSPPPVRRPASMPPPAPLQAHLQILHETPRGMSAWQIGPIDKTTALDQPVSTEMVETGPVRHRERTVYEFDKSRITQDALTYPGRGRVDYETTVEWKQVGNAKYGGDMLKAAFAIGLSADTATYEIPFGDVSRPNDGHENVALKWCDLSTPERGVAVLNDCKHGHDVKDGVIRLTLLRSSYDPDPEPDVGTHHMRYAAVPHDGPLDKAAVVRAAWEFNEPMQALVLTAADEREHARAWSGCSVEPTNVIVTAMKRAEDGDDIVLRAYECAGKPVAATFRLGFEGQSVSEADLLERDLPGAGRVTIAGRTLTAEFKPYEIRTFRVAVGPR
jgi:alpha-mannosidase